MAKTVTPEMLLEQRLGAVVRQALRVHGHGPHQARRDGGAGVIEPFDEKRHQALIQHHPIQVIGGDGLTHKLDAEANEAVCARDGYTQATRATEDWRLVNCPDCRAAGS